MFWPAVPVVRVGNRQLVSNHFPNELARVCDSVGKSPAWRGLDHHDGAAFPSHFRVIMVAGS